MDRFTSGGRRFGILFLSISQLMGCSKNNCGPVVTIEWPASPLGLKMLNSPYDDWNCGLPWEQWSPEATLLFSSNRKSQGGDFDFIPMPFMIRPAQDSQSPVLEPWHVDKVLERIAAQINSKQDELGPSFWFGSDSTQSLMDERQPLEAIYLVGRPSALVFSRGGKGNHDLMALIPSLPPNVHAAESVTFSEKALTPLNTAADEGYATWARGFNTVLFHSNRNGKYRIYQATFPSEAGGPFKWLQDPDTAGVAITLIDELASEGEERCPFIRGNDLYFLSNRKGGLGGFDIYRSTWNKTTWSTPENLGPAVNSPSNEYRPVPISLPNGSHGLIFSSDRPGGLGGYDLYLVKLAGS